MAEVAPPSATPVVTSSASDPSPRTLEFMYREAKQLEDKILLRFDAIQIKFSGYDAAVRLLQEFTNRQPTVEAVARDLEALTALSALRFNDGEKLTCEKFKGVAESKIALDIRYDQLDGSNKEAISAALRAAEKAVEKTEMNFTKQIDGIISLINQTRASLDNNISDIKERVTIIEANKQGGADNFKTMLSVIGAIVALATIGNIIIALIR